MIVLNAGLPGERRTVQFVVAENDRTLRTFAVSRGVVDAVRNDLDRVVAQRRVGRDVTVADFVACTVAFDAQHPNRLRGAEECRLRSRQARVRRRVRAVDPCRRAVAADADRRVLGDQSVLAIDDELVGPIPVAALRQDLRKRIEFRVIFGVVCTVGTRDRHQRLAVQAESVGRVVLDTCGLAVDGERLVTARDARQAGQAPARADHAFAAVARVRQRQTGLHTVATVRHLQRNDVVELPARADAPRRRQVPDAGRRQDRRRRQAVGLRLGRRERGIDVERDRRRKSSTCCVIRLCVGPGRRASRCCGRQCSSSQSQQKLTILSKSHSGV